MEDTELFLNYIPDPTANGHAVNLRYANNTYLKLAGGTMTGNITMNGGTLFMRDADGNEKPIQGSNGFIRSYDQVRDLTDQMMLTALKLVEVARLTLPLNLLVKQRSKHCQKRR